MNSLDFSRIYYESTIIHYRIINYSWIYYQFPEFTIILRINYEFTINFANSRSYCEITMNSISFTQIHYDFTVCFGNLLWIQFFREFTILFSTQLWIHFLFGELTLNSLSISQICFKNTSFFANKLKIHQQIHYVS